MTPTFDQVYRAHRPFVRRWVTRRYGEDMADDVLQETFFRVWQKWSAIGEVDNLRRWLIGIAKFVAGHMLRAAHTLTRGGGMEMVEWNPEVDQRAEPPRQELQLYVDQLRSHFAGLGPAQRDTLTALADGESALDIAERTGKSLASTTMAISLGRKRLREKFGDDLTDL